MKVGGFLSKYLRAKEVEEPQVVTIASVEVEEVGMGEDKEEKLVLYTKEIDRGVVLGAKAVLTTLTDLFGEDTDDWIGRKIELFYDPNVLFKSKPVGGLRVRGV